MSQEVQPIEKEMASTPTVTKKDLDDWLFGSGTKLTDQQKTLFYQVALSCQLNPVKREIYAIPFGNNFNIITGYEVYLKRAERTGLLDGWDAKVEIVNNELVASCTVYRKDRAHPTTIQAWFKEYDQGNRMWKEKPRTMIRKVAIAQAFRMAFPDELGGLPYTSDEISFVDAEVVTVKPQEAQQQEKTTKAKQTTKQEKKTAQNGLEERKAKAVEASTGLGFPKGDLEAWLEKKYEDWGEEELKLIREWYQKNK